MSDEITRLRQPGGELTTVRRTRDDGRVTVVRAAAGSYREDVASALLDVVAPAGTTQPIDVPGFALDRALVLGADAGERVVVAVHRSEVLDGESEKAFRNAISSHGTGLLPRLDNWERVPVPRADARLLDDWPGGMMRPSERFHPWPAERMLTLVAPSGPADVRVEIRSMGGHALVLQRRWDRGVGTLTHPDGTSVPVDLPRRALWERLGPVFLGDDLTGLVTVDAGTPETDVLEMRYQTEDRGWASLPMLEALDGCVARLDRQILRAAGNWAVFTSRSDAVIQVECTESGRLWLETPEPETKRSWGLLVTVPEAAELLTILAREDRSAVATRPGAESVAWD
ncbi:hypothetical protein [Actinoplanes sp. HUAS TT8]|uniref:hypothetical protein n=1 Tax=Actinoplanes sp. HUAS TT8 TaxID=3447453 RepID=UPI003F52091F